MRWKERTRETDYVSLPKFRVLSQKDDFYELINFSYLLPAESYTPVHLGATRAPVSFSNNWRCYRRRNNNPVR